MIGEVGRTVSNSGDFFTPMEKSFAFNPEEWNTPNTYNFNFKQPPNKSGVYLLVKAEILTGHKSRYVKHEILYVGSSRNLKKRYNSHEVLNMLQKQHDYIQFYFKEVDNHFEIEKELIKLIQPKYNKKWL